MTNTTRRRRRHHILTLFLAMFVAVLQVGCGDSSEINQVSGQQGGPTGGGDVFAISAPGVVNNAVTLEVGDTLQFSAGVAAQSTAGQLVLAQSQPHADWSSSNKNVATISDNGLLTGVGPGQADVTASVNGRRSANSIRVTITDDGEVTLTTIILTAAPSNTSNIAIGSPVNFTATGTFSDGSTANITNSVTFSSSNSTVGVAPGGTGAFTALDDGSTVITASRNGRTSNAITVTVAAAAPILTSISLNADDTSIFVGDTATFTATGNYSDGSTENLTALVTFTSGTPSVGLPPNASGSFTALEDGTTVIAASLGTATSNTVTITVANPPVLTNIAISPSDPTIEANGTIDFVATGTFSDGSNSDITNTVTWTSSNIAAGADPASNGVFTASAVGTTDITASRDGVTSNTSTVTVTPAIVSITITSNPPPSPPPPPPAPPTSTLFLGTGATANFTATATLADSTTTDITDRVAWNSSNPTAGEAPSSTGAFTAGSTGGQTTNITATRNGVTSNSIAVSVGI